MILKVSIAILLYVCSDSTFKGYLCIDKREKTIMSMESGRLNLMPSFVGREEGHKKELVLDLIFFTKQMLEKKLARVLW